MYVSLPSNCVNMEDVIEYELLDIELEWNYEFDLESPGGMVRDTTGDEDAEEDAKPSLVYDENGIPMGISSEDIKQRRQMIFCFYEQWKSTHPERSVYNKSLKANILIRQESVVEAAAHAAKQYKSTLAVFKLDEVLSNAVRIVEDLPKTGNKNQRKLIRMILMSFRDQDLGTIKLSVGVRNRTLDKVQYGITALAENETIVAVGGKNKKKAPHKK